MTQALRALDGEILSWCPEPEVIRWLSDAIAELRHLHIDSKARSSETLPSGHIEQYPIYAALAEPKVSQLASKAQTLLLVLACMREERLSANPHESAIKNAGLGTRQLVKGRCRSNALAEAWHGAQDLRDFEKRIIKIHGELEFESQAARYCHYIRPLLRYCLHERDPPNRGPVYRRRRHYEPFENIDSESGVTEYRQDLTKSAIKIRRKQGLSDQLESEDEQRNDYSSESLAGCEDISHSQLMFRARSASESFKSYRQVCVTGRTLLFPHVVKVLEHHFESADLNELNILIALMLLTGGGVEHLQGATVCQGQNVLPDDDNVHLVLDPGRDIHELTWQVPALPNAVRPNNESADIYCPMDSRISLPLPFPMKVAGFLTRLYGADQACLFPTLGQLSNEDVEKQVSNCLSKINKSSDISDLSRVRLIRYTFFQAILEKEDVALAHLISRSANDQRDSRRHYSAYGQNRINEVFQLIWAPFGYRGKVTSPFEPSPLINRVNGSRVVPTIDALHNFIAALGKRLNKALNGRRSIHRKRLIHNTMTAYVLWQVMWTTGIRPVIDPIEYKKYLPLESIIIVCDKDTQDRYGTRAIVLPPSLRQQIESYLKLIREFSADLGATEDIAFCLIGTNNKKLPVNVGNLKKVAGVQYPFVDNCHRHYVRTALLERGVRGSLIDALLGHSTLGGEAYSRFSPFSPADLVQHLSEPLEELWLNSGWQQRPTLS